MQSNQNNNLENESFTPDTKPTKVSFIIKNLFPIISISIILIGLIILYKAGNVEQYITDEMRIGFGYFISLSLLLGYFSDKIRQTFFSQILLSTILSSLTITTLIGTNVYSVIPNILGIVIMAILFLIGLSIAYIHKSEIEFTTTAIIGALIPVLFHSNSFALFLGFETGLFLALYIYLYFFKQTKVFQYILYWSMSIASLILLIVGIQMHSRSNITFELTVLLFIINMSLIGPIILAKWKLISFPFFRLTYFLQLVIGVFSTFIVALSVGNSEFHTKSLVLFGILLLILIIGLFRKDTSLITAAENLHTIIFALFIILALYLPHLYIYKFLFTLIFVVLHIVALNFFFEKENYPTWKTLLRILFYTLVIFNAFPLFIAIFAFVLHLPLADKAYLHDKLITASFLLTSVWGLYFFTDNKRAYAIDKSQLLVINWIVTAMYFLYIPWQLTNVIFLGNGLLQLVLISILWLSAAFITTIIALKNGRLGLRIFTIIIIFFLTAKLLFIDIAFFLESNMSFQLSLYIIAFGLATLVLSRLLILEYSKNGSLMHEWQKFIQALRNEKQHKEKLKMENSQLAAKAIQQQISVTPITPAPTAPQHIQPTSQTPQPQPIPQPQPQPIPQPQPQPTPQPQPIPQPQSQPTPTPQFQPITPQQSPIPKTPESQSPQPIHTKAAETKSDNASQIHTQYILNILNEQWEIQNQSFEIQQSLLDIQQENLLKLLKQQKNIKRKIDYLTNEIKKNS